MPHIVERLLRKKRRVRAHIEGSEKRPRVSVYRSNKYIYAQAIDDVSRVTVVSSSSVAATDEKQKKTKKDSAFVVGQTLGAKLKEKGITEVVFDRSYFIYKGRVQALADGLREAGIKV